MDPVFIWIERSAYSVWVREAVTLWAFPFMLILHAIGMGLLAGLHIAMCLRVLGLAPMIPLPAMRSFFPFLWFGLAINVFSGVSLLIAYPTKALTNPLFYVKMALIAAALVSLRWMRRNVFGGSLPLSARTVAGWAIFFWVGAIFAGRWLAYTYTRLMAS
ncbi:MAG: hypothetical protein WDO18_18690 [Acidobacteriota bacterium]